MKAEVQQIIRMLTDNASTRVEVCESLLVHGTLNSFTQRHDAWNPAQVNKMWQYHFRFSKYDYINLQCKSTYRPAFRMRPDFTVSQFSQFIYSTEPIPI